MQIIHLSDMYLPNKLSCGMLEMWTNEEQKRILEWDIVNVFVIPIFKKDMWLCLNVAHTVSIGIKTV